MDATAESWISSQVQWERRPCDLSDTNTLEYEYAPVKLEDAKIVITNSKVKHSLVDSAYNDRRNECERALKELKEVTDIQALGDLTEEEFEKI